MPGMVSDFPPCSAFGFLVVLTGSSCDADKPDEMLASDSKLVSGQNPTIGVDSPVNR